MASATGDAEREALKKRKYEKQNKTIGRQGASQAS
jgi:hypothetical protein